MNESTDLFKNIDSTSQLAVRVSSKVKKLDLTRSRISECQIRVHDLIDLHVCKTGVLQAFEAKDYETASVHLKRFLSMDTTLLCKTASDLKSDSLTSVSEAVQTLQNALVELRVIVDKRFQQAAKEDDIITIERYFKIYPLLGLYNEGIKKFFTYVCQKLKTKIRNDIKLLSQGGNDSRDSIIFADAITIILENYARIIKVNYPVITSCYGYGKLFGVVKIIQKECDEDLSNIMKELNRNRKMSDKINLIQDYNKTLTHSSSSKKNLDNFTENLNAKETDTLAHELVIMHSRAELYMRFVKRQIKSDISSSAFTETDKNDAYQEFEQGFSSSGLKTNMQELISLYILLETYFMNVSVLKAIAMDVSDAQQTYTPIVDDVFFIIRKCIKRSIVSHSIDCICAIINNSTSCLEQHYLPYLQNSIKSRLSSSYLDLVNAYSTLQNTFQQRFQSSSEFNSVNHNFSVQLNNADKSISFMETLLETTKTDFYTNFNCDQEKETILFESCLSGLKNVIDSFKAVISFGFQQLRSAAIKPRLHPWVDHFLTYNHQPSINDSSNKNESNETFSQFLIVRLDSFFSGFNNSLNENNSKVLQEMVVLEIATRLERAIRKSKFNRVCLIIHFIRGLYSVIFIRIFSLQLGGLMLEENIRNVELYFEQSTSWSVKDKLTRLSEIASILAMEKVIDLELFVKKQDLFSKNIRKLSSEEIKNILLLRVDG